MGAADQVLPTAVETYSTGKPLNPVNAFNGAVGGRTMPAPKATIGGRVSDLRGVVTVWYDGIIASMNPYPKEWKFRGRRSTAGWYNDEPWYPEKATIYLAAEREITVAEATARDLGDILDYLLGKGVNKAIAEVPGEVHAMNPAHMIYECVTNPEWGRGIDPALINENSFVYSANTFCSEMFGLCMTWFRKEEIDTFIQTIIDHVGAALYTDRDTGLLTLRPIRADYVVEDLPLFTLDSGLIDVLEDDSGAADVAYSEVIVKGHDPVYDVDFQMRAHNLAAWQETGASNTLTVSYPGLPTRSLTGRVAARELKVHASGLQKFKVTLYRRAWKIAPASCFRIYAPHR